MSEVSNESKNTLYCSFCGKNQHEVKRLIAGPTIFICDECVLLSVGILVNEKLLTWENLATEYEHLRHGIEHSVKKPAVP